MRYLYLSETDGREALAAGLRALGHVVVEAAPRDGVVEVVRELPRAYDAIIVDSSRAPWDSDAIDFLEVARHCDRANPGDAAGGLISDQDTAVVVISSPASAAAALHCGADMVVCRPAGAVQISRAVEDAIRHRRRQPPRLLLVDADPATTDVLSEALNHGTFDVDSASNASLALALARRALDEGRPYTVVAVAAIVDGADALADELKEIDHSVGVVRFAPEANAGDIVDRACRAAAMREAVTAAMRLVRGLDDLRGMLSG